MEPFPAQGYCLYLAFFILIPVAVTVDSMVSRIGPKWSTSIGNGGILLLCDTNKSNETRVK